MQIFIKTYTGKRPVLEVAAGDLVASVKKQIWEKEGIPPEQQLLYFAGRLAGISPCHCGIWSAHKMGAQRVWYKLINMDHRFLAPSASSAHSKSPTNLQFIDRIVAFVDPDAPYI